MNNKRVYHKEKKCFGCGKQKMCTIILGEWNCLECSIELTKAFEIKERSSKGAKA